MKTILHYLKPYRMGMLRGFLIKVLGTFADLGLPWVLAYILDHVVPLGHISPVLLWGVAMVFLAVAARLLNIKANRMASKVARDAIEEVRHDLFHKIMYLSGNQTDAIGIPSLISRLTADSYNVHSMIGRAHRCARPIYFDGRDSDYVHPRTHFDSCFSINTSIAYCSGLPCLQKRYSAIHESFPVRG